jgi:hypothetical protein
MTRSLVALPGRAAHVFMAQGSMLLLGNVLSVPLV